MLKFAPLKQTAAMQSGEAADLAIFIVSCCLLVGYWVFYFTTESFTIPIIRKKFINLVREARPPGQG